MGVRVTEDSNLPLSVRKQIIQNHMVGEAGHIDLDTVIGPGPKLQVTLLHIIWVHACNNTVTQSAFSAAHSLTRGRQTVVSEVFSCKLCQTLTGNTRYRPFLHGVYSICLWCGFWSTFWSSWCGSDRNEEELNKFYHFLIIHKRKDQSMSQQNDFAVFFW